MSRTYVGRRKCSVALVSFIKGTGEFIINRKTGFNYFQQDPFAIQTVVAPLKLINLEKKYDIICVVRGGGICAQAEAIRLGIARALCSLGDSSLTYALPSPYTEGVTPSVYASKMQQATQNKALQESVDQVTTSPQSEQIEIKKNSGINDSEWSQKSKSEQNKTRELFTDIKENSELSKLSKNIEKNNTRSILKEHGFLRRDSRIKERRKYGLKKARKAEQYSKR